MKKHQVNIQRVEETVYKSNHNRKVKQKPRSNNTHMELNQLETLPFHFKTIQQIKTFH